ncbi:DUF1279 superfamily [Maublancomyces gigas]|uniref:DUF1279 superfamily n=1 Tax=Discina gigas TaxID=1032678 RepID=A0ABR3GTX1_9PEZI
MASRVLSRSLLSRSLLLRSGATHRLLLPPTLPHANLFRNPSIARFTSSAPPAPSLSQRLKALSKEYGYSALGVYLALSALDFPFCFLAVRYLGAERVGLWEEAAVQFVKPYWTALGFSAGAKLAETGTGAEAESKLGDDPWVVVGGEKSASLWTELALAYAVHKSFIFIRVPLTAAVTPKIVKVLRGWGWNIGKKGKSKINITPIKNSTPPPPPPVV